MQTSTSSLSRSMLFGSNVSSTLASRLAGVVLMVRTAVRAERDAVAAVARAGWNLRVGPVEYEAAHVVRARRERMGLALWRANVWRGAEVGGMAVAS